MFASSMFASSEEEVISIVCVTCAAVFITFLSFRHKARNERLKTIQKAIESGNLDDAARQRLLDIMAAEVQHQREIWRLLFDNGKRLARILVFVVGWLTLTIGGLVLVGMLMFGASRYDLQGAMVAVAIGFGLVTLPMAIRELDGRRIARG